MTANAGRETRVPVGDALLWTVRSGHGFPLVLSHGGPGLNDNLAPLAATVDDLAEVLRYDQRGCDRSTAGSALMTVDRMVDDLEALRAYFDFPRWIVGGHSWGATLSLFYALRYPERCAALVYVSGPGLDPEGAGAGWDVRRTRWTEEEWAEVQEELMRVQDPDPQRREWARRRTAHLFWVTDFADRRNAPDPQTDPLYTVTRDPEIYRALTTDLSRRLAEPGLAEAIRSCRVPALVLRGAADPIPARLSSEIAGLLPEAEYHEISDVGHTPWLERPERLAAVLRPFLSGITGRPARPEKPDRPHRDVSPPAASPTPTREQL